MTLALAIANPSGAWISTDYQVTNLVNGKPVSILSDTTQKHMMLTCTDGGLLLGYTGVAQIGTNRLDTLDWLMAQLAGEARSVAETVKAIEAASNSKIAEYRIPHAFALGGFLAGRGAVVARVTNMPPGGRPQVQANFSSDIAEVGEGRYVITGSGRTFVSKNDVGLLQKTVTKRPRAPEEYCKLLGGINERTASTEGHKTVSRHCIVSYLPPTLAPLSSHKYNWKRGKPQPLIPMMFPAGVNLPPS